MPCLVRPFPVSSVSILANVSHPGSEYPGFPRLDLNMCICVGICAYMYSCTCMYIHVQTYLFMYISMAERVSEEVPLRLQLRGKGTT